MSELLEEYQKKCRICPFPVDVRCESGIPCTYNKEQGGDALRKKISECDEQHKNILA